MNEYKLKVATATLERDILLGNRSVSVDYHRLNTSTGRLAYNASKRAVNPLGLNVEGLGSVYIFGFERIYLYSGQGADEADWQSKFIGMGYLDPAGQAQVIAGWVKYIRLELNTSDPLPKGVTRWYVTKGATAGAVEGLTPAEWADGVSQGNFDSSTAWQELSGLTAAYKAGNSDYLWVLSDSPANMIAAVSKANASNQGVWTLSGSHSAVDWEDIESSIVAGIPYLYVFDYGNNPNTVNSRGTGVDMVIHRVLEPTITGSNGSTAEYIAIPCVFPASNLPTHRDSEGSIIDPVTGDIYIITKREAIPGVYKLPHQATYTGIQTLTYLGKMWDIPDVTVAALGAALCNVVEATINKAGTEIIVKNYNDMYLFLRDPATQTIFQALQAVPTIVAGYVGGGSATPAKSHPSAEPQGEGVCFDELGVNLYSNSEYAAGSTPTRYPLFKYSRLNTTPLTASFQDGAEGYAGTLDTYIWDTNPAVAYGTEATFVVDNVDATEVGRRKGLLKFDLSSIPANAIVVGAKVDLNVAVEGQGWAMYKMLVPWSEASTYTSLGGVTNDGVKAAAAPDCVNGINLDMITGFVRNNVPAATVQSWVDGSSQNYGWMFDALDAATGDGVQFTSREGTTPASRPKMTIRYVIPSNQTVNIWADLDLGADEPAMTYQVNDIAELKDRQADYSQELTLPPTKHNLATLGLPQHIDSQTDFPYRSLECRLYAGEFELAGKGAVLSLDEVTDDGLSCQILGSNASLFDLLEDSPMSALTEPSFTREYGGDLVPAAEPNPWPNGFEFVAASFTKGAFHHLLEMNPVYMLPVVKDKYLMGKIIEAQGYTWEHNLAAYPQIEANALPVVTLDPDTDSLLPLDCQARRTIAVSNPAGAKYYFITPQAPNTGGLLATFGTDGSDNTSPSGTAYTFVNSGKVKIVGAFTRQAGNQNTVWIVINHKPVNGEVTEIWSVTSTYDTAPGPYSLSTEITVEQGDQLIMTYLIMDWSLGFSVDLDIHLSEFSSEAVPLYGKVHAPRNLGFDTQFDYFKSFVQRYGLTVKVDHSTKTVHTYTMKRLYDNKVFARDWSDKLVENGRELAFRADGYARSNSIAFKDNDEDSVKDKGTFTVADENLEKEKTLFDMSLEAGLDWGATTKFASVPVFTVPDLDDVITTDAMRLARAEYSGGKPHLVELSTDTVPLFVVGYGENRNYHRIMHVTAQSLIDDYYLELTTKMLVKAKRLVCKFYLKPADIEAFDPFTPVYLKQYGAYFYVNKINNFIFGRLTSVELIKL